MRRSLLTLVLLFIAGPCWGAIARVNQGCFGNITITGTETITQTLGWTTASGDFLVLTISGLSITITSATGSGTGMTQDVTVTDPNLNTEALMRLANTGSVSSVTVNFTGSNGSVVTLCAAEYSGVSTSATPVNTAVTGFSGFVNNNTWTNGSYTATTGNLVIAGAEDEIGGTGSWGVTGSWTLVTSFGTLSGTSVGAMLEEQLNVSAGAFIGTGTWPRGVTDGAKYTYFTVSYPAPAIGSGGGFGGKGGIGGNGGMGD
jgi:hypothetical protein